jgi:DNA (cytosine-5)-methyltransferase 1
VIASAFIFCHIVNYEREYHLKNLNAISLFSGVMGLDLGIEKAGFSTRVCVELDKLACQTVRANSDIPVIEKDINDVTSHELLKATNLRKRDVSLVFGGPPCQAFSTAGARRALDDFRGNVIINFLRIVEEIRPPYFILENVRGIYSSAMQYVPPNGSNRYSQIAHLKGGVLYYLVQEFKKMGYLTSFSLFNSANYGVPQIRERMIMFGSRDGRVGLPIPTHTEDGKETGKKWVTFRQAVKGLREGDMHYVELSDRDKHYLSMLKAGQYWKHLPEKEIPKAMGNSLFLGGGKTGFFRRLSWDRPSPTLVTSPAMPATMLAHPSKLRPLSIEEYSRIQQFPPDWEFKGSIRDIYKQIGNAVPCGLGEMAGKAIIDHLEGKTNSQDIRESLVTYSRYRNTSDFEFLPWFERLVRIDRHEKQAVQLSFE